MTHEEKMKLLIDEKYPLSAKYDPEWIYENKMGCQCLWLVESLSQIMTLKPGMRILDMGCGNALTSIFLAKEFGVTVFANNFFDAVVCINSFQFYGTADNYLSDYMAHLIKPDGQFGLVVWGPDKEFTGKVPADIGEKWWPDFYYFHSLDWWKWHFEKTGLFSIEAGDDLAGDGVRVTRQWAKIMEKYDNTHNNEIMRWNRMVAKRNSYQADDFRN